MRSRPKASILGFVSPSFGCGDHVDVQLSDHVFVYDGRERIENIPRPNRPFSSQRAHTKKYRTFGSGFRFCRASAIDSTATVPEPSSSARSRSCHGRALGFVRVVVMGPRWRPFQHSRVGSLPSRVRRRFCVQSVLFWSVLRGRCSC